MFLRFTNATVSDMARGYGTITTRALLVCGERRPRRERLYRLGRVWLYAQAHGRTGFALCPIRTRAAVVNGFGAR